MRQFTMLRGRCVQWMAVFGVIAAQMVLVPATAIAAVDVQVNDSTTDTGNSTTQNETALAFGNGVLCAGFNDFGPNGLSGYASSDDLGSNWTDQGGLNERGDPVIVHHAASDTFYYASLGSSSIRVQASTDGCQNFGAAVNASTFSTRTNLADKPWLAVDNTGGTTDGNLYVCWTRFFDSSTPPDGTTDASELRVARSTDGGTTWTNEQVIAASGTAPFGCSIAVASDGSVAVAWADRSDNDIDFRRSTDAGVTWGGTVQVNSGPLRRPGIDNVVACGGTNRPTLNGNIRQLHQAWLSVDTSGGPNDGNIYVVYASDPAGNTDQADVFFSRSTDNGATWSNQVQMGTGGGATDQFEPNVAVADNGDVGVVWYDRRNDTTNNMNIDVYTAFSSDGGSTFGSLVRVTDQSFGVPALNPHYNPGAARCYMGEYQAIVGQGGGFYYLWGDNRNTVTNMAWPGGRPDADVFFDVLAGPSNQPPVVSVDPASGQEGSVINLTASASDADGDFLTYDWTATPSTGVDAGAGCTFTDETVLSPQITCSDDGVYQLDLVVTGDPDGPVTASNQLTVTNVDPSVTLTSSSTVTIAENAGTVDVSAAFTDPGWSDTYSATVDWGVPGEGPEAAAVTITTNGGPGVDDAGTVDASHTYGDNGSYTVTITVTDDDEGSDSTTVDVTVTNVDPTATIDTTGATTIQGVPTVLAEAGEAIDFDVGVTDPGSDDLVVTWDWDDGAPVVDETTTYLVNPPGSDPLPSPSVQPRDVTDSQTHTFGDACMYDVVAAAEDDDAGTDDDTIAVLVRGLADRIEGAGYWFSQFRFDGQRNMNDLSDATLSCYLDIVGHASAVFSELRDADDAADATAVLNTKRSSSTDEIFEQQLLAAWLNFAHGSLDPGTLVDTDGDDTVDAAFSDVIADAEAVRLAYDAGTATDSELEDQKTILERINLRDSE